MEIRNSLGERATNSLGERATQVLEIAASSYTIYRVYIQYFFIFHGNHKMTYRNSGHNRNHAFGDVRHFSFFSPHSKHFFQCAFFKASGYAHKRVLNMSYENIPRNGHLFFVSHVGLLSFKDPRLLSPHSLHCSSPLVIPLSVYISLILLLIRIV